MMMKRTAVAVTPAAQFGSLHQEMIQTLGYADLSEPIAECEKLADQAFGRNFAAQAGPHSGPWAERKRGGTGKIGERDAGHPLEIKSGDLFEAITSPFGRGHIEEAGPRSGEIGVDAGEIPYAAAQNYGFSKRKLPQREMADITDKDADEMAEIMADAMLEELLK
jgi:phage gpG-like protein